MYSLRISGHTVNVGSDSSNKILSEQRAKTCYEYLAASGIDAARMSFYGFGENKPIASNNTAEGKRLNRRTEFELYIK
ncbi:MAG: OmpA family protein [Saprospiraceae bacterium]|nr:OmpA family protein [Saprospiraceae bacterium]